jgi:hypothetical protein
MQFTSFLRRCTTSGTRHGKNLFQGEFPGFHQRNNATFQSREMLDIAHFQHIRQAARFMCPAAGFANSEQK